MSYAFGERNPSMKQKKQWSLNWLNEKKSKRLGHVDGITYRHAAGYKRLENGQLVRVEPKAKGKK